jgi:hypothetical protein
MRPKLAAFPKCYLDELCVHRMTPRERIEIGATLGVNGLEFFSGFLGDDEAFLRETKELLEGSSGTGRAGEASRRFNARQRSLPGQRYFGRSLPGRGFHRLCSTTLARYNRGSAGVGPLPQGVG